MLRPDFDLSDVLPFSAVDKLSASARPAVFEPGRTLFRQGDACAGIYLINSGIIGLRLGDEAGESALLNLCRTGGMLGHAAWLGHAAHNVTAEVLTISRVLFVDRRSVDRVCQSDPRVKDYLVQAAIRDLHRSQHHCAALLTHGLKTRLINTLLSFVSDDVCHASRQTDRVIHLPIQRKDLAALIGAAPESLSRLIGKLEADGLIKFDGRQVRLSRALLSRESSDGVDPEPSLEQSMLALLMEARAALLTLIDTKDCERRVQLEEKVERASEALDALLRQNVRKQARSVSNFAGIWEAFKATRRTEILPAVHAGKTLQAKKIAMGIQAERLAKMRGALAHGTAVAA